MYSSKVITCDEGLFPWRLRSYLPKLKCLYYKGLLDEKRLASTVGVVGTRKCTEYARIVLKQIVPVLVKAEIAVISGFMYGVDSIAHEICVEHNGYTVAVMPCGIDLIHPSWQWALYNNILVNKGLIISQYAGEFKQQIWSFPERNKIIAALSDVLVVIEAPEDSGALITANYAHKYQKKVFVVLDTFGSINNDGLINISNQYASVINSPKSILDYFNTSTDLQLFNNLESQLTPDQSVVYSSLKACPKDIDSLINSTSMSLINLLRILSELEECNCIYAKEGRYYAC